MPNKGNAGIAHFASILDKRMKEHQSQERILDFGEILAGYQLQTNTFPVAIPAGDYMVCRSLTIGTAGSYLTNVTTTEGSGSAYVPESMRMLQPGDHVLLAWVENTAVVIDLIQKASSL